MKRIVLSIIVLFFITGCDVTYNVTINNDKVSEKITLIENDMSLFDKTDESGMTLRETFDSLLIKEEFGVQEYKVKSLNKDDQLGVEYSSTVESLQNLSGLNQCYTNPTIVQNGDIITINTGENFECYEYYDNLDKIVVKFKTNHKVEATNASYKDGNTYVWELTKDSSKNIQISYYESYVDNTEISILTIVGLGLAIIVILIALFIKIRLKRENSI